MYELPEIREARDTWAAAIVRQYKAITRARGGAGAACKIHQGSPYLRHKAIMSEQDKKLCICDVYQIHRGPQTVEESRVAFNMS